MYIYILSYLSIVGRIQFSFDEQLKPGGFLSFFKKKVAINDPSSLRILYKYLILWSFYCALAIL